jgi:hypothetical protein
VNARYFAILSHYDTPTEVVLTPLEWMALLFVPLTRAEQLDYGAAALALANSEALRLGLERNEHYEDERAAFLQALATLARLPGGVQFGRLHFGNDEEWTITI